MNFKAGVSESGFYDDLSSAPDKFFTMGSFLASPVVVDGVIYIGSTDGFLYALK